MEIMKRLTRAFLYILVLKAVSCQRRSRKELLSLKLKQVADQYSDKRNVLVLYNSDKTKESVSSYITDVIEHGMRKHEWLVEVSNQFNSGKTYKKNDRPRFDLTFLFLQDDFLLISKLETNPFWDSGSRILVVIDSVESVELNVCFSLVEESWRLYRALDMTIMMYRNQKFILCTLNPYTTPERRYVFEETDLNMPTELFPEKISDNAYGNPLYITVGIISPFVHVSKDNSVTGLDFYLIVEIAERLNFSISFVSFITTDKQIIEGNMKESAEMTIGAARLTIHVYEESDAVNPYFFDALKWIVPRKKRLQSWERLQYFLFSEMWAALTLTTLLSAVTFYIVSYCYKKSISFVMSVLLHLSILLNVSVPSQPKTLLKRILFMSFILYAMHISVVFDSSLTSVLTMPVEKYYQTMEEIIKDDLCLVLMPDYAFIADISQVPHRLSCLNVSNEFIFNIGEKIAFERQSFTIGPNRLTMLFSQTGWFDDEYGKPLLYPLRETFLPEYFSIFMKPRHPLLCLFNRKISHIIEAGLINYWFEESIKIILEDFKYTKPEEPVELITLTDLLGPLIILGSGLNLSFFVFLLENFIHRVSCKNLSTVEEH